MSDQERRTVLFVANRQLPPNDYRIGLSKVLTQFRIIYGLPGRTTGLHEGQFVQLPFREGLSVRDAANFLRLGKYLWSARSQLYACHFFSTKLILGGPIVAAVVGVRSIVTVTGLGRSFADRDATSRVLRALYLSVLRASVALTKRVLFQNRGDMALLCSAIPALARKAEYIGSAVDSCEARSRTFEGPVLRILLVSRLLPSKGISDFLRVATALDSQRFEFVLVGPKSSGYESLSELVRDHDRRRIIRYMGEISSAEVALEMQRAHVLLFPSSYGEGIPRVLLECGYAGLCPIAYKITATMDLIADGRGFLVPSHDIDALASRLLRLYDDRDLLRTNAVLYQAHILEHYSMQAYAQRINAVLGALDGADS